MVAIKSPSAAAQKWARRAGNAGPEYEEGVRNPRKSWAKETAASVSAYNAGVQKAIQNKSFEKGVAQAGDNKWQTNAVEKGPARYSQGVQLAEVAYEQGFAPYAQALNSLTLPPRKAKGDPANLERVAMVAKTLHETKLQRRGK